MKATGSRFSSSVEKINHFIKIYQSYWVPDQRTSRFHVDPCSLRRGGGGGAADVAAGLHSHTDVCFWPRFCLQIWPGLFVSSPRGPLEPQPHCITPPPPLHPGWTLHPGSPFRQTWRTEDVHRELSTNQMVVWLLWNSSNMNVYAAVQIIGGKEIVWIQHPPRPPPRHTEPWDWLTFLHKYSRTTVLFFESPRIIN